MKRFFNLTIPLFLILVNLTSGCSSKSERAQKKAERLVTQYQDSLWADYEYSKNWHALEFTQLDTVYYLSDTMAIHKQEEKIRARIRSAESPYNLINLWGSPASNRSELEKLARQKQEIIDTYSEGEIKYLTIEIHVEWDTPLGKLDDWIKYKLDTKLTRVLGEVD